jgi:hypothetical protein
VRLSRKKKNDCKMKGWAGNAEKKRKKERKVRRKDCERKRTTNLLANKDQEKGQW